MHMWLALRLILAVIFALVGFIFSDVVPSIPPFSSNILRFFIAFWSGLLGFGVFPDLAKWVTLTSLNFINFITEKVSSEVINQMLKIPRGVSISAPSTSHAPVGGVSMNMPVILDTSAIIDGRILDIAKTGFISGVLLLPSFVLEELQQVADSSDYLKRSRGRRGFEVIEEIKKIKGIRVEVWDKGSFGKTVDEKLVKLGKSLHGKIITTDFNLNKVATLSNVSVLNVNDLANAVKAISIPGEVISVKVIHLGKDPKQGVGYFPDGTMVVIEDGAKLIGRQITAEVTRTLQVPAGRMVFAKKVK